MLGQNLLFLLLFCFADVCVCNEPSRTTSQCDYNDYIPERYNISCSCSTAFLGEPRGSLTWYMTSNTTFDTAISVGQSGTRGLSMSRRLDRSDVTASFSCDVEWISTRIAGQEHNVTVAYGPDSVSISGIAADRVFVTDSSRSQVLTLTSEVNGVSPASGLSYTWDLGPCDSSAGRENCSFRPLSDIRRRITVTNPNNNNRSATSTVSISLQYPPDTPPSISGYSQGQVKYEGDGLNLRCSVRSQGNPRINNLTLTCPGHYEQAPAISSSTSLTIPALNASDDGMTCQCSGYWPTRPDFYTLTDNQTVTVYYPPSEPVVNRTDGLVHPYLENDRIQLRCNVQVPGNPTATLRWSGHPSIDSRSSETVTFTAPRDRVRNINCTAENDFTRKKNIVVAKVLSLQIYYSPSISFTVLPVNKCQLSSGSNQCIVTEGQRVALACNADSNPDPDIFQWRARHDGNLDLGTGHDLDIISANRSHHNGIFRCTVTTAKPVPTDNRLPLHSTKDVQILVKYQASDVTLTLNNRPNSLTLDEGQRVTFNCQAYGRPAPTLRLTKKDVPMRTVIGTLSLTNDVKHLSHTISSVRYDSASEYNCRADNEMGQASQTVNLYVNIMPRKSQNSPDDPPSSNFTGNPVTLTFNLLAYPEPDTFTFYYLGTTQNETESTKEARQGVFSVVCNMTSEFYAFRCDVTARDFRSSDETGYYRLRAANFKGRLDLVFYVRVSDLPTSSSNVGVAVGVSVGVLIVVAAVVAVIVFFVYRRRKQQKDYERPNLPRRQGTSPYTNLNPATNAQNTTQPDQGTKLDVVYANTSAEHADPTVVYANTQYANTSAVGEVASPGQHDGPYQNVELKGTEYENLDGKAFKKSKAKTAGPAVAQKPSEYVNLGLAKNSPYQNTSFPAGRAEFHVYGNTVHTSSNS